MGMIQHLRYKFIGIATAALVVVLFTIIGSMVSISAFRNSQIADAILTVLSTNRGKLTSTDANQAAQGAVTVPRFSQEDMFQYRYFTAVLDSKNQIKWFDNSHIMSVAPDKIADLAQQAKKQSRDRGNLHYGGTTYAFRVVHHKNNTTTIAFLDLSTIVKTTNDLMASGIFIGIGCLILFEIVLIVFSRNAIEPLVKAEKRQKEFITNAGHELKTPLSIISANNEMQEMLSGENEWTQSTDQQVKRMTRLISQMISLAKMEERPEMQLRTVDFSTEVTKAADNFKAVIEQDQHQFIAEIDPNLQITADPNYCYELISILLDNANKYCDPQGTVAVKLTSDHHSKNVLLAISNDYADGKNIDYSKFFERFYRNDKSHHHTKRAGFGIGLSMAQKLVKTFHGQINAKWHEGKVTFTVQFKAVKA